MGEDDVAKKIWETLSKVDVNEHKDKKGEYDYLPWNWGWSYLMDHYPGAVFEELPNEIHDDGTVTVRTKLTINGITRPMWLAVLDYGNKSIKNPTASDISDAKMRCFTKNMAMFGLGFYIYKGEGVPSDSSAEPKLEVVSEPELDGLPVVKNENGFASDHKQLCDAIGYNSKDSTFTGSLDDLDAVMKEINSSYDPKTVTKVGAWADVFRKRMGEDDEQTS